MANLETLELTINANADKAKQGIETLTRSLSSLSKAIGKSIRGLVRLNSELKTLKSSNKINFSVNGKVGAMANAAKNASKNAMDLSANNNSLAVPVRDTPAKSAEYTARWLRQVNEYRAEREANIARRAQWRQEWNERAEAAKNAASETSQAMGEVEESTKKAGEAADVTRKKFSGFGQRVGRIFSTMITRMAIKYMIKNFQEAWSAAYQFSQKMGGEFAKNLDSAKAALRSVAINIVRVFSPAMQAVSSVLSVVATGVKYLCDLLQQLLTLLGVSTELFGANADEISDYGEKSKNAAKEMLASFDELNVISSKGGGGGGGDGDDFSIADKLKEEIEQVKVAVGEALLAVGLILAFSGQVPVGLALAAVGAAAIAGTIVEKWGTLSTKVQGEITTIMAVAGGAMAALGLILAVSGANLPLGIALIAVGVANMAVAASLSWNLDADVKQRIANITAAVGGGLMAIGAILAFTGANMPLGIGLMAAGAVALGSAIALSWSLDGEIKTKIGTIASALSGALLALGAAIAFTGASLPLGIGLMIAGAAGLATSAGITWNLDDEVKKKIASITAAIGGALLALGAVLAFTGANMPLGIGLMVAGAASLATSITLVWGLDTEVTKKIGIVSDAIGGALLALGAVIAFTGASLPIGIGLMVAGAASLASSASISWGLDGEVKKKITTVSTVVGGALVALGAILAFTGANIPLGLGLLAAGAVSLASPIKENWESMTGKISGILTSVKKAFETAWDAITKAIQKAWDAVKKWWTENISTPISTAWNEVQKILEEVWSSVSTAVTNAWNVVKTWFGDIWKKYFDEPWHNIKTNLSAVWNNVKLAVEEAWKKVQTWAAATWDAIKGGWETIKSKFLSIWNGVGKAVKDAWDKVTTWASATWEGIKGAWESIQDGFEKIWQAIGNAVSAAWSNVKNWVNARWGKLKTGWASIQKNLSDLWGKIGDKVSEAWGKFKDWINARWGKIQSAWGSIREGIKGVWNSIGTAISNAWDTVSKWWDDTKNGAVQLIKNAWEGLVTWFRQTITEPIAQAFTSAISTVKEAINKWIIRPLNSIGHIETSATIRVMGIALGMDIPKEFNLWTIPELKAAGDYDIPSGQVFIAREAGAEMVGAIGNHTTVANNEQIVEGIRAGVADANAEQNVLLKQQNELLRGILQKDSSVRIGASAALGRTVRQSLDMYSGIVGG